MPIEIIGHNEQLTTQQGNYLGGIVNPSSTIPSLANIYQTLQKVILPRARKLGWFGVGGIDVIIDEMERFYFIDPNFRMTAAFAYVYLSKNNKIKRPIMSFIGTFREDRQDFLKKVSPLARENDTNQMLSIIAMTQGNGEYRFNAGMFFDSYSDIPQRAEELLRRGISSTTLERLRWLA